MTKEERAYNYASSRKATKFQVGEIAKFYNDGYEQAKRDLALTADDIGRIFHKVIEEAAKWNATEACYPDVVKWFNEYKNGKD